MSEKKKINRFHVFLSHFHWDHLQGLPFFVPAYNPANKLDMYSPVPGLEKILNGQMVHPYFPVTLNAMGSRKTFNFIDKEIEVAGCRISTKKMNHPGDSYAYCVNLNGKRFIYATDTELNSSDFQKNEENTAFFQGMDKIFPYSTCSGLPLFAERKIASISFILRITESRETRSFSFPSITARTLR